MEQKVTKTERVLRFIKESGNHGRRFREIQKFVVEQLNGKVWQDSYRGYWCTHLLGAWMRPDGILHTYCRKNDQGRWVLVAQSYRGHLI